MVAQCLLAFTILGMEKHSEQRYNMPAAQPPAY